MNCKWARKEWGANLQSCLTGKCLKVLETLSIDDANDYDILKKALLNAFQCNAEGFMNKFKTCKPEKDETFSTYLCRQAKLLDRWLELAEVDKSSPEELIDFFRRDQVYSVCHPGLVGHLKESQPKSCKELEDLAMKYQMAHPQHNLAKVIKDEPSYFGATGFQNRGRDMTRGGSFVRSFSAPAKNYFEQGSAVPKCSFCQKKGHHKSQCRMTRSTGVTCFKCHRVGHYANDCPQRFPSSNDHRDQPQQGFGPDVGYHGEYVDDVQWQPRNPGPMTNQNMSYSNPGYGFGVPRNPVPSHVQPRMPGPSNFQPRKAGPGPNNNKTNPRPR